MRLRTSVRFSCYAIIYFVRMKIKTGKGYISLVALIAVWSVSAQTSLPGLAVSPILGNLEKVFPRTSEFDIQMLTSLPSLLTIPFILIAGHISRRVGYIRLLYLGLSIFLLSGILYLFANDMWQLIALSALLGAGAGIIIPLSTSIVSRFFVGEYRTRQFGFSSAVSNVTLVLATILAGYLAEVQWRLSFVVYLLPVVSLILLPSLSRADKMIPVDADEETSSDGVTAFAGGVVLKPLSAYMIYYFLITFLTVAISYSLPFVMNSYGYDSGKSGVIISLFYLAIMFPGFMLNPILRYLHGRVEKVCLLMIAIGLSVILLYRSLLLIAMGCLITGFGYGIAQPFLYDRASRLAAPGSVPVALALLMTMNYIAILVYPFIADGLQHLLQIKSVHFALAANVIISFASLLVLLLFRVRKNDNEK